MKKCIITALTGLTLLIAVSVNSTPRETEVWQQYDKVWCGSDFLPQDTTEDFDTATRYLGNPFYRWPIYSTFINVDTIYGKNDTLDIVANRYTVFSPNIKMGDITNYVATGGDSWSSVLGGRNNSNADASGVICGGENNEVSGGFNAIVGGDSNWVELCYYGVISGGKNNFINWESNYGVIGGGQENKIGTRSPEQCMTIGGGKSNWVQDDYGTIGGGRRNYITGALSTIGGGYADTIKNSEFATIGGGKHNIIDGDYSTIPGGYKNLAEAWAALAAGWQAIVLGDESDTASMCFGTGVVDSVPYAILFGDGLEDTLKTPHTFAVKYDSAVMPKTRIDGNLRVEEHAYIDSTATIGDTTYQEALLSIHGDKIPLGWGNVYGVKAIVEMEEASRVYGGYFAAGAHSSGLDTPITYPVPTLGYGLEANNIGVVGVGKHIAGHQTIGVYGEGNVYTGTGGAIGVYGIGRGDTIGALRKAYGGYFRADTTTHGPQYGIYAEADTYGIYAKSPGMAGYFEGNERVTGKFCGGDESDFPGTYSFVGGGQYDTAKGNWSTIGGGYLNETGGVYSFIGGGWVNVTSNNRATIGGGGSHNVSGEHGTIAGGDNNEVSGPWGAIGGGTDNVAAGRSATIAGGDNNEAPGDYSFIGSGERNITQAGWSFAHGRYAIVLGDSADTASGCFGTGVVDSAKHAFLFGDGLDDSLKTDNTFAVKTDSAVMPKTRFTGPIDAPDEIWYHYISPEYGTFDSITVADSMVARSWGDGIASLYNYYWGWADTLSSGKQTWAWSYVTYLPEDFVAWGDSAITLEGITEYAHHDSCNVVLKILADSSGTVVIDDQDSLTSTSWTHAVLDSSDIDHATSSGTRYKIWIETHSTNGAPNNNWWKFSLLRLKYWRKR